MLSDCPVGWGHEPREFKRILDAAVETRFWPLYEVVDGTYRLTYEPEERVPVEEWLKGQKRFAHLLDPKNSDLVEKIQRQVAADWRSLRPLRRRCSGMTASSRPATCWWLPFPFRA